MSKPKPLRNILKWIISGTNNLDIATGCMGGKLLQGSTSLLIPPTLWASGAFSQHSNIGGHIFGAALVYIYLFQI